MKAVLGLLAIVAGVGIAAYVLRPSPADPTAVVTVVQKGEPAEHRLRPGQLPDSPAALARELQRELKRVGCYEGDINGVWTTSTRLAMSAFTERVNAKLPVDKPDQILLSLVQGHEGKACSGAGEPGKAVSTVTAADKSAMSNLAGATGSLAPALAPLESRPAGAPVQNLVAPGPPANRQLVTGATQPDGAPTSTGDDRQRRFARHAGPLPRVGVYERRYRRSARRVSRPPRFVRSLIRNMQRTLASFGIP
jgi:hypothetical protein